MRRLPLDAFVYYVSLGQGRTYQAVALHFGVTLRAVAKRASAESWKDRLRDIERETTNAALARAKETITSAKFRDIQKMLAARELGLQYLVDKPIETVEDAVRVIDVSLRSERMLQASRSGHLPADGFREN